MAAVTANTVFCRAPVAGARVSRTTPAAAARVGAPAPSAGSIALKGSKASARALRVSAGAPAGRRASALRAITDTKDAATVVEEKEEPKLESDVRIPPRGAQTAKNRRRSVIISFVARGEPLRHPPPGRSRRAPARATRVSARASFPPPNHPGRERRRRFSAPARDAAPAPRFSETPELTKISPIQTISLPTSQAGVDYTALRDLLKAGEWEEADNEHRRLMCVLAGEDAEDRGWVYFTEARQFPVKDLLTIDALWTFYSDGKFGFSVQRKIWVGQKRQWTKFFKQIDWVQGENNAYRKWPEEFIWKKEAARGHMPLTNALRGTQLLEALLEHPAFAPAKPKDAATQVSDAMEGAKKGLEGAFKGLKGLKKPDWMK